MSFGRGGTSEEQEVKQGKHMGKVPAQGCALGHGAEDERDVGEAAPADVVHRAERGECGSGSVEVTCRAGRRGGAR